jgi:pimeloyl-ACP methyl ester carboxylesterase
LTTHRHLNGSGQVASPGPETARVSGSVTTDGVCLGYVSFGAGEDTVILLPPLLMSRTTQAPLARSLALRHIRVICLDYLGQRADGAPHQPDRFSSDRIAAQVLAALDELEIGRALIGGTSIGSNIAVEAALADPERFTGLLLEGPFLEHAQHVMALVFSALFAFVTFGRPAFGLARLASRALPGRPLERLGMPPSMVPEDPSRAAAFLQGLLFGRIGPPRELHRTVRTPALVIGFPIDSFHPQRDARALTDEFVHARLV